MAALSSVSRLSRRLSSFRLSYSVLRCVATNSNLSEKQSKSTESGADILHDGLTQRRDPLAVLKALARTVKPTALAPPREFFEDLFLYPKTQRKREECKAARESGFKAAEFVLQEYPQLFPMRNPEPAWEQTDHSGVIHVQTEDDLKVVISKMNPQDAIDGYEKLISEGVSVSLDTMNELLDLVGYYGTVAADDLESQSDIEATSSSSESDEAASLEESESSDEEEEAVGERHKNTWRMNNYAEKLFLSMKEKNARTYDAMILALSKHNYPRRAFELFREMREENFQASILTYNVLLHKIPIVHGNEKLWDRVMEIIGHMKTDPVVVPTRGTYHIMLKLCVLLPNGSEKAVEIFRDMQHKGIEPSLGTYSLLLRAEYHKYTYIKSEKGEDVKSVPNNSLLQVVISQLESYDRLPSLQDISDVRFFNTAMDAARYCLDSNAAHRLYALSEHNDPRLLSGKRGYFYANFLSTLAQSEKSAEIVYHMYRILVPEKVIPQTWVYRDLFRMLEREQMPRFVPMFYEDMKKFRVPINEQVSKGIFSALARRTSAKNHEQYVEILEDVFFWMAKFNIPVHPYMITLLIKQYCAGNHLKQAWDVMKMFDEHNFKPTYTALIQLLDCCGRKRDKEEAMKVFELFSEYGYLVPKRKRSTFFDNVQMPLSKRVHINNLFNLQELDKRRDSFSQAAKEEQSVSTQ